MTDDLLRAVHALRLSSCCTPAAAAAYRSATPFPHAQFDDFLPESLARALVERFPQAADSSKAFDGAFERRKHEFDPNTLDDPLLRSFFFVMNSGPILADLEALTGIGGLCPDPWFFGGGFHETRSGGKLGIHADFLLQKRLNLRRRINLLIYLNPDWQPDYGGNLELWSRDMQRCEARIAPLFNRCVIFSTDRDSFHGHPDPLTTPPHIARRSIALYYYTASPAIAAEIDGRGGSTDFRRRPGQDQDARAAASRQSLGQLARDWCPPALYRGLRKLAGKG